MCQGILALMASDGCPAFFKERRSYCVPLCKVSLWLTSEEKPLELFTAFPSYQNRPQVSPNITQRRRSKGRFRLTRFIRKSL